MISLISKVPVDSSACDLSWLPKPMASRDGPWAAGRVEDPPSRGFDRRFSIWKMTVGRSRRTCPCETPLPAKCYEYEHCTRAHTRWCRCSHAGSRQAGDFAGWPHLCDEAESARMRVIALTRNSDLRTLGGIHSWRYVTRLYEYSRLLSASTSCRLDGECNAPIPRAS